jgi:hypothetical protein
MNELRFSNDRDNHFDLLLATSEIGVWEFNISTGSVQRNLRHDQIFGHQQLLSDWSDDIFLTYVVP